MPVDGWKWRKLGQNHVEERLPLHANMTGNIFYILTKPRFGDRKTTTNISLLGYITEHVCDDDCDIHIYIIVLLFDLFIPYARNLITLYTTQDYTDLPGSGQAKK